ncbi:MAG TPA: hypothetical protein PKH07_19585, partial [bacterium]|nr:hypothetical protein [bacterium]
MMPDTKSLSDKGLSMATLSPVSPWLGASLIILFTLCAHYPVLLADYVWDDDGVIVNNEELRDIDGLWRIWMNPSSMEQEHHYWPLTYSTFWLEYQIWGARPLGYHVNNLVLHTLNALLFWWLLARMRVVGNWFAAALFAVHPVHVESIAWVTERKGLLAGLFFLLAFHCFVRFRREGLRRFYLATCVLFVLGLLSKSSVFALPLVLAVWLWFDNATDLGKRLLGLVPIGFVGLGMGLADWWFFRDRYSVDLGFSLFQRLVIAGRVIWFYLSKIVVPFPLLAVYPRWELQHGLLLQCLYPTALLLVAWILWWQRKRTGRAPLAAVASFVALLLPVLGF